MIYQPADNAQPISQGDIFKNIPRIDMSLSDLIVCGDDGDLRTSWANVVAAKTGQPVTALLDVRPVTAIVITQDCDASREDYISLCVVDDYLISVKQKDEPKNPGKWARKIAETSRSQPKVFYLPKDKRFGIEGPKGASFLDVLRVPLWNLMDMRNFRVATLNSVAKEHFRECLGHFFRRYSYNEWYPLSPEQFEAYKEWRKDENIAPYEWQK